MTTHSPATARCRSHLLAASIGLVCALALSGTASAYERAHIDAPAAARQSVAFNIYLPVRDRAAVEALIDDLHSPDSPNYRHWLQPQEFDARFGPSSETVGAIRAELGRFGLKVTDVHTHSLHVVGTVDAVSRAFGAGFSNAHLSSGRPLLVASGPLKLTPTLERLHAVIPAFSGTVHMTQTGRAAPLAADPLNRQSATGGYWFDDLKQAYAYPSYLQLTGTGVSIGVLMTPGFNPSDMTLYFSHENIPVPNIQTIDVEGGAPYNPSSAAETHLDIQHSGGMAPQASITLFNLPDLYDDSIMAGLTQIVEYNNVDIVNMSFGGPELAYTAAYNGGVDYTGILGLYDDFFAEGNALGITFVASSGDSGSNNFPAVACFQSGAPNPCGTMQVGVGTPAISPHVTAVGGTNLVTTYDSMNPSDLNSAYVRENANGDPLVGDIFYGTTATNAIWGSGGGISTYFKKPGYQKLVSEKYLPPAAKGWRTIPDVSLEMGGCPGGTLYYSVHGTCPADRSYDWVAINGQFGGYIGTSLSSPEFVGLTALKIQYEGGRLGNANYEIYRLGLGQETGKGPVVYRRDIKGTNGAYKTAPGYNLVLGNGTVVGNVYVAGAKMPVAGVPQTPSNP